MGGLRQAALVSAIIAVSGCASILGIEDTVDDPAGTAPGGGGPDATDEGVVVTPGADGSVDGSDEASALDAEADGDAVAAPACDLTKPFSAPTIVSISTTANYETAGRMSGDELTIYFEKGPFSGGNVVNGEIYQATRTTTTSAWGTPSLLTSLNSTASDGYLTVSADGLTGYFASIRSGGPGGVDIFVSTRASAGAAFGSPSRVTAVNGASNDDDPYLRPDGLALYFDSDRGAGGDVDIFRSTIDGAGNVSAPSLVSTVNTNANETEPVVTPDDLTLFFARGNAASDAQEIFVSTRATTAAAWGAPSKVTELNSNKNDRPTWISADGCRILISSTRSGNAGSGDVYFAQRPP
jgi:hypothetical protein